MLRNYLRSMMALLAIVAGSAIGSFAQAQELQPVPLEETYDESHTGEYAGDCQSGDCQSAACGNCGRHGCPHCGHGKHHGRHGKHAMGAGISSRDLFYNYYVGPAASPGPTGANSVAAMYPSPLPTPPLVGHTYITYQPLYPHEFLYTHNHTYYSSYPGGGQVTTRVKYRHSIFGQINPLFGPRAPFPRGPEYLEDPLRR